MVHKRFLGAIGAIALAFFATASPSVASPSHDLHLAADALAVSAEKADVNFLPDIDLTIANTAAGADIIGSANGLGDHDLTVLVSLSRAGFDLRRSTETVAVRTNGTMLIASRSDFRTEATAAMPTDDIVLFA